LLSEEDRLSQEEQGLEDERGPFTASTTLPIHDPISRNIPVALAYTGLIFAGRSVWSQSVLSTFVFLLRHEDTRAVGIITAAMGLAQLLTSLPAGYLADRYRRDTLLRTASAFGLVAMAATLYAIVLHDYRALVVGLAVWGSYWGICNTALSALFADSIPTGQRSHYFTQRSLLVNVGFCTGPAVSLLLFFILGDTWTIRECAFVMAAGQFVCLPAVALLWGLSDDHIVLPPSLSEEEGEGLLEAPSPTQALEECDTRDASELPFSDRQDEEERPSTEEVSGTLCICISPKRRIAVLIAAADLTSGLASGMSIRYFPIFFVENLHMGPMLVQVLYMLTPIFIAGCMKVSQKLSTLYGRCRVSVAFKWIGVVLMYSLVATYDLHLPRALVATIYILRSAFMNCTGALTRSVLMDNVPPSERGRWAALESLNMFSWSGSAALGGYLVGWFGMMPLFCMTAGIQLLATLPLVLLSLEEKLEGIPHEEESGNAETQTSYEGEQRYEAVTSSSDSQRRAGIWGMLLVLSNLLTTAAFDHPTPMTAQRLNKSSRSRALDLVPLESLSEELGSCCMESQILQQSGIGGESLGIYLPEEDDLDRLSSLIVEGFGADAIALSTDLNAVEEMLVRPFAGFLNGYAGITAYAETIIGLRQRLGNRLLQPSLAAPDVSAASSINEQIEIGAKSALVLVVATANSSEIVASVELRLQATDGKISFSWPWLDRMERRIASLAFRQSATTKITVQPYLSSLCVREDYRKRGIGLALVNCLESVTRICWKPYTRVYLHVDPNNTAALKLYENAGYRPVKGTVWNPFWAGRAADILYYFKNL
jgi:MFS family permease/GNAT superfamily N-acetyltransferase